MYHDIKHEDDCRGMRYAAPEMRDCTCGVVIDALLAERASLQKELDDLKEGRAAVIPKTKEHAAHLLLVAEACYHGNENIQGFAKRSDK